MAQIKIIEDADANWDLGPESDSAIETRLLGAEDVYWDADGTGDFITFTDRTGTEQKITGINSGKIPLQADVRAQLTGTKNVSDALKLLAERTGSSSAYAILDDDLEVMIGADLSPEAKQNLIDIQTRNLGGYTLTFKFPESLDLAISYSFLFSGFYNGKLVIDLNEIELSDVVLLDALILLQDCTCPVTVTNGTLKHTVSNYAVKAVRCPAVILDNVKFSSGGRDTDYALFCELSDAVAENCIYDGDRQVLISGFLASVPVANHNDSLAAHSVLMTGKADAVHSHTADQCGADEAGTAAALIGEHNAADNTAAHPNLAPLDNPVFTGTPIIKNNNTERTVATTADVSSEVSSHNNALNPHPGILAPLDSPAFTGTPTAPTPVSSSNDTTVSTTKFVKDVVSGHNAVGNTDAHPNLAKLASPALTGTPTAPDPEKNTSSQIATVNHVSDHNSSATAHRYLVPAGVVFPFAGAGAVPTGFLLCDGRAVSRLEYPDLFAAIGTTYGIGDGSTTFNVPDFRGQFLRGYESGVTGEIGTAQKEGLPDIGMFIAAVEPNVGTGWLMTGYFAKATQSTDLYGNTRQKANDFASYSNPIYGNSEHVTPVNYAIQWIIKW